MILTEVFFYSAIAVGAVFLLSTVGVLIHSSRNRRYEEGESQSAGIYYSSASPELAGKIYNQPPRREYVEVRRNDTSYRRSDTGHMMHRKERERSNAAEARRVNSERLRSRGFNMERFEVAAETPREVKKPYYMAS